MPVKFKRTKKKRNGARSQAPPGIPQTEYIRKVSERAFSLYEKRGKKDGYHEQDWAEAEAQIKRELNK